MSAFYWSNSNEEKIWTATISALGGLPPTLSDAHLFFSDIRAAGIFIDEVNKKFYWTKSVTNTISVADISDPDIPKTPTNSSILFSDGNLAGPYGLFIDTVHSNLYWTNFTNSQIWVGTISDLTNPTEPSNQHILLPSDHFLIPTGICLDIENSKIYWSNLNPGGIWVGDVDDLSNPTTISNPLLLFSDSSVDGLFLDTVHSQLYWSNNISLQLFVGNISDRANNPTLLSYAVLTSDNLNGPSGLFISGLNTIPASSTEPELVPNLFQNDTLLTLQNINCPGKRTMNLSVFDTNSTEIYHLEKTFSDNDPLSFVIQSDNGPILSSDTYSLTLTVTCLSDATSTTINREITGGNTPEQQYEIELDGSKLGFKLTLPSDFNSSASNATVFFSDICSFANLKSDHRIKGFLKVLENLDMFVSDAAILKASYGVFVSCSNQCLNMLEQSKLFSFQICSFTSDPKIIYSDRNPANTLSNHPVTIASISPQISDTLTFTFRNLTGCSTQLIFSSDTRGQFPGISGGGNTKKIKVQGSQKSVGTRQIKGILSNVQTKKVVGTIVQTTTNDGAFELNFSNIPVDNLTLEMTLNTIPQGCSDLKRFALTNSQKTLTNVKLSGSLFFFELGMSSDFQTVASDQNTIISDMCAYAQTLPLTRIPATFEVLEHSDVMASDASILLGIHDVYVVCSDSCLRITEQADLFFLKICSLSSDTKLSYTDSDPSHTVSDKPVLIESMFSRISDVLEVFSLNLTSDFPLFKVVQPCTSDPLTITTPVFNHPLLEIDAGDTITDIGLVEALPLIQNPSSDLDYVCKAKTCTTRLGDVLELHFSDYKDHISDRQTLLYEGPLRAGRVKVDLNNAKLIFYDIDIACSDNPC